MERADKVIYICEKVADNVYSKVSSDKFNVKGRANVKSLRKYVHDIQFVLMIIDNDVCNCNMAIPEGLMEKIEAVCYRIIDKSYELVSADLEHSINDVMSAMFQVVQALAHLNAIPCDNRSSREE